MSDITFNPDPKLQAEAMIEQFMPIVAISDNEADDESMSLDMETAISCALIAAKMCKSVSRPGDSIYPGYTGTGTTEYWSAVIEHLEKA